MSSELSEELQGEIMRELSSDLQRMRQLIEQRPSAYAGKYAPLNYQELEQLVYITEQIRLKLRTLGAPRIYQ